MITFASHGLCVVHCWCVSFVFMIVHCAADVTTVRVLDWLLRPHVRVECWQRVSTVWVCEGCWHVQRYASVREWMAAKSVQDKTLCDFLLVSVCLPAYLLFSLFLHSCGAFIVLCLLVTTLPSKCYCFISHWWGFVYLQVCATTRLKAEWLDLTRVALCARDSRTALASPSIRDSASWRRDAPAKLKTKNQDGWKELCRHTINKHFHWCILFFLLLNTQTR